jgi:hypothetical protein
MYIVMNENLSYVGIFKEITPLSELLGVSRTTVYNHKGEKQWKINGYTIIIPDFVQKKSNRGGQKNFKTW